MAPFCRLVSLLAVVLVDAAMCARITRPEGDIQWRDFPIALPSTGFISAKSAVDTVMLKISRKINSPGFCQSIEIINQPSPNTSPFVGSNVFTLIPDKRYNDHYAWSNGHETLSFIPTDGNDEGNWLIGNDAGVDNGYVFLATSTPSLTPLNLEGPADQPDYQWKWLMNMQWQPQPAMRAVCKDTYKPGPFYYEVEYFDQITHQAVKSALVPDLNPYILSLHNQLNKSFNLVSFLSNESNLQIPFPAYYERSSDRWRLLEGIAVVAEFGSPVEITRSKQATNSKESHIAVLVNEEHSGKLGWRLAFRNFPFTYRAANSTLVASPHLAEKEKISITQIGYHSPDVSPINLVDEEEYTIEIDNTGCLNDYRLQPVSVPTRTELEQTLQHSLETVQPGEYVWIWHAPVLNTTPPKSTFTVSAGAAGGAAFTMSTTGASSAVYDNDWSTEEVQELLLRCKSRTKDTIVFQYFMTDRRDVMRQSQLERDTDFLVMHLNPSTTAGINNVYVPPMVTFRNRQVHLKSLIVLGHDLLNYLRRFLLKKEGATHGLSSCYMYHAAVSMPQALIYAAEILCVLLGSKPVTMIQYTTSSDHQWKFPLVQELTRSIVGAKQVYGSALDLSYVTFTYRADETLIIYRTGKKYLVDQLMPYHEAQALHPVPYPDESRLQQDWKEQIYNSAWNGFVLGYPGFFVESYCEGFHNGLSLDEKRKQLAAAERNFQRKMQQSKLPTPKIKLGSDEPITVEQYEFIRHAL